MSKSLKDVGKNLRASLGIPEPTDKERAERKIRWRAQQTAECCGKCGLDLKPDDPVWRTRISLGPGFFGGGRRAIVPLCDKCKGTSDHYEGPRPCESCGRPVANEPKVKIKRVDYAARAARDWRRFHGLPEAPEKQSHWFCSERCAKRCYGSKERDGRAAQRFKVCPVCGESFEAQRLDAKTCSSPCRQKAYRRRVTDATCGDIDDHAGPPPNSRNGRADANDQSEALEAAA